MIRPYLFGKSAGIRRAGAAPTLALRIPGGMHMNILLEDHTLRLRCCVCGAEQTFTLDELDPLNEVRIAHHPDCGLGQWIDDPASRTCSEDEGRQWAKDTNDQAQRIAQAEQS
jgi:hypothetical protein